MGKLGTFTRTRKDKAYKAAQPDFKQLSGWDKLQKPNQIMKQTQKLVQGK